MRAARLPRYLSAHLVLVGGKPGWHEHALDLVAHDWQHREK